MIPGPGRESQKRSLAGEANWGQFAGSANRPLRVII